MNNQGKISMDWGGIFDILAILNVKVNLCLGDKKDQSIYNFQKLSKEIKDQLGDFIYSQIMGSDEYKKLYDSNLKTFHKVGEAKQSTGLAREVDICNQDRFVKKNSLQQKFFGSDISEVKV